MGLLDKFSASLSVTVQRPVRVSDGQGGFETTFEDDHTETVYIGGSNDKDATRAHQKTGIIHYPCYLDAGADIEMGDRIVTNISKLKTYEVRETDLEVPEGPYLKALLVRYVPNG